MKSFKRILSLAAVIVMLLNVSLTGFSVSAADAGDVAGLGDFVDYYPEPESGEDEEDYYYCDIYGDADFDGAITVRDATLIQKYLASLVEFDEYTFYISDVDGDENVTVKDATAIQKAVADITSGVPMQPVYNYDADSDCLNVEMLPYGGAFVNIVAEADGYYTITATANAEYEYNISYVFIDENSVYINGGYKFSSYLTAGTYKLLVSSICEYDTEASIAVDYQPEFTLFDTNDAVELMDKFIDVEAGAGAQLFKITANDFEESIMIATDGTAPMLNASIYDCTLSMSDNGYVDDSGNLAATITLPANEVYYLYITQAEGGSDYTVFAGDMATVIENMSVEITLNYAEALDATYVEENMGSFTTAYTEVEGGYKFTPEESGYYKFTFRSEAMGQLIYIITDDASLESYIGYEGYMTYGPFNEYDIQKLEADKTYYIILYGAVYGETGMTITVSESTESEYNKLHRADDEEEDDILPEAYETVSVGDTVEVTLADSFDAMYYVLTAESDATIVVYSQGSVDGSLFVYDLKGNIIGSSDDISILDIYDFCAVGDITAGETYIFEIGTYNDASDNFTVSLVYESDYVPYEYAE